MGKVEEYFDKLRLDEFLAGKRESPFSQDDMRWAQWMRIDLGGKPKEREE